MRKNGAMFICNRCRKQVFAERLDDGKYDSKPLDGWALDCERICGVGDLCPDCFKAYREAMEGFWNSGNMEPEKICCNCRWHEGYTGVCFNGLSLNCTDVTDIEDSCEHWEKRTDDNGIEDYEVN